MLVMYWYMVQTFVYHRHQQLQMTTTLYMYYIYFLQIALYFVRLFVRPDFLTQKLTNVLVNIHRDGIRTMQIPI